MSAELAITIYGLIVPICLILIPIFKDVSANRFLNFIIKGAMFILGIYFFIQTTAMVSTIAEGASLGVTQDILSNLHVFLLVGEAAGLILFVGFLVMLVKIIKDERQLKGVYEDEEKD